MKESDFTKAMCKGLEEFGCIVYPIVAQAFGLAGWPDRLVVCPPPVDKIVLLEFKGVATKLAPRQRLIMERINRCSAQTCFVVRQHGNTGGTLLTCNELGELGYFNNPSELWGRLKNVLGN